MRALLIVLFAGAANGQSMNIDLGDRSGVPDATYAGVALPGTWNVAFEQHGTPNDLRALDGSPTDATLTLSYMGDITTPIPGTTGDLEALYDDFGGGIGDVLGTLLFEGLEPGRYEIVVHAWAPGTLTSVFLDDFGARWIETGGEWNGEVPEEGLTYGVLVADVESTLDLGVVASRWGLSAAINGVQLVHRPCLADWDSSGSLDIFDILGFLEAFDAQRPIADVNLDGTFDIFDALSFLDLYDQGC